MSRLSTVTRHAGLEKGQRPVASSSDSRPAPQLRLPKAPVLVSPGQECSPPCRRALNLPGARQSHRHVLVPDRHSRTPGDRGSPLRAIRTHGGRRTSMKTQKPAMPKIPLGPVLRRYFCEYLVSQRDLSPQTIGSYRDTFRLLLEFLERRYRIKPDVVCVDDLDSPRVLMFLDDLERRRGNTARTRNNRLVAIRSFLRHAAAADPLLLPVAQRAMAIPAKRFERASVGYLTREQIH